LFQCPYSAVMPTLQFGSAWLTIIAIFAGRFSARTNARENRHDLTFEASCPIAVFTVITVILSPVQYYHVAQPLFSYTRRRIR
jgi:hypothetical protein